MIFRAHSRIALVAGASFFAICAGSTASAQEASSNPPGDGSSVPMTPVTKDGSGSAEDAQGSE
ncbi:MAG: hypothetical protein JWO25_1194, partial [Alphaproteobacteria bacterium]|nr:hypothetical protein [Alphaproteobacteria bacterium]